jgi:virginiamycin B lyase
MKSPVVVLVIAALASGTACGAAPRAATSTAKVTAAPAISTAIPLVISPPSLPTSTPTPVSSTTPPKPTETPSAAPRHAAATPSPAPTSSPTASPSPEPQAAVTLYNTASDWSLIDHLRLGPDGALWFTTAGMASNEFGRITADGVVTTWPFPWTSTGDMADFTFGGGFLWALDVHGLNDSYIGQWTLTGTLLREFPVPWTAYAITWGPDGALWFSGAQVSGMELSVSYVARMTVHGAVTTYSLPDTSDLAGTLSVGPDGDIWFSEYPGSYVGRVTTSGAITEYEVPHTENLGGPIGANQTITAGPDGAIWAIVDDVLVKVTMSGTVSVIPVASPESISTNPDGDLWLTTEGPPAGSTVVRLSTSGVPLADYSIGDSEPSVIATGSDGMIWFGDSFGQNDDIARLDPSIPPNA